MRKTFTVGEKSFFWVSKAKKHSIIPDRINYLICLIEDKKSTEGVIRKHELIENLIRIKGTCFIYNSRNSNKREHVRQRGLIEWLMFRFCELPMSAIGKHYGLDRNTPHKAITRVENEIVKGNSEIFNELFNLITNIKK